MSVTAYSYISANRSEGYINLVSDTKWTTTNWTAEALTLDSIADYSLLNDMFSGSSSLSDDGLTLSITVPYPPERLLLKVGSFAKIFSFYSGSIGHSDVFSVVTDLTIDTYPTRIKAKNALALFNGTPVIRSQMSFRAVLIDSGNVIGYMPGQRFTRVTSPQLSTGGVIFPLVYWINRPTSLTQLSFTCDLNDKVVTYPVAFNGNVFTSPVSSHLRQTTGLEFTIDRSMTSFYNCQES